MEEEEVEKEEMEEEEQRDGIVILHFKKVERSSMKELIEKTQVKM